MQKNFEVMYYVHTNVMLMALVVKADIFFYSIENNKTIFF